MSSVPMTCFNGGRNNLRAEDVSSVKGDQIRQIRTKECIQVHRKCKPAYTGSEREKTVKVGLRNILKVHTCICTFAVGSSFPLGPIFRSRQFLGERCKDPLGCHLLSLQVISILDRLFLTKRLSKFSLLSI